MNKFELSLICANLLASNMYDLYVTTCDDTKVDNFFRENECNYEEMLNNHTVVELCTRLTINLIILLVFWWLGLIWFLKFSFVSSFAGIVCEIIGINTLGNVFCAIERIMLNIAIITALYLDIYLKTSAPSHHTTPNDYMDFDELFIDDQHTKKPFTMVLTTTPKFEKSYNDNCLICYRGLTRNNKLNLPCLHGYCEKCFLANWYLGNNALNCAYCRAPFDKVYVQYDIAYFRLMEKVSRLKNKRHIC